MMASAILFALAIAMAGIAIWLFVYADRRERRDDLLVRLHAGDQPGAPVYISTESRLRNPILRIACRLIWRTGVELEPKTVSKILWVLAAIVPLAILLFDWFGGTTVIALMLAFGYGILRNRAARRRRKIVEQMPGFLEGAMRVLQAGNTLEESLATAAVESPEPLRPLFQSVGRQVRLGAPLDQVLVDVADVHGIRDIKVLALAASINRKYGGSLRNVFRSLISAIRSRDAAARELRALTAETRFSALVLAVIPAFLTVYIYLQNRLYYADMWASLGGRITLITAVAMQVAGVVVIYRMMGSTEGDD
ncbi:MAG: type II secretion system F family protein [Panacagrimonas sp.]